MLETLKALAELLGPRMNPDQVHEPDHHLFGLTSKVFDALGKYFRAEVHGLERMPDGKALLVGNHNAGITFLEPFFLAIAWYRHTDGRDPLHGLGHDAMVSMPLVGNLLQKLGVVRASHETARAVFRADRKVMVFPGGNYEAFRPFKERHRVDFGPKTGFVRLALKNQVPIVPILSLGGHDTFVVLHRGEKLAKLTGARKYLRSESFPLFLGLPWGLGFGPIFHLPLPAPFYIEVLDPIPVPYGPEAANDPERCAALAREVQARLQAAMDQRVAEGKGQLFTKRR